jgi:hypothetical protein
MRPARSRLCKLRAQAGSWSNPRGACLYSDGKHPCICSKSVPLSDDPQPVNRFAGKLRRQSRCDSRYRDKVKRRYFRGDAAFANPKIYEFLEAEGYGYAIRLPTNSVLQGKIKHLLKRPVGRPPQDIRRFFASFVSLRRRPPSWGDWMNEAG